MIQYPRSRWTAALLLVLSTACDRGVAVEKTPLDVPEEDRYGGTAVAMIEVQLRTLFPGAMQHMTVSDVLENVLFTPVIRLDESLQPVPALAERWEVSEDGTELTFHLRDDLYWHDGVKTTAWDVKFAHDLVFNENPELEAVVADSFTLRVAATPQVDPLLEWRKVVALPRHLLDGVDKSQIREHPYGMGRTVGNGPFRIVSRAEGELTFLANERHPAALGGRPYLDTLIVRSAGSDSIRIAALREGSADFTIRIPVDRLQQLKDAPGVRLEPYPSPAVMSLHWNNRRPPFDDRRVRRALGRSIDKPHVVEKLLHSYGMAAYSSIPQIHWAFDASMAERARRDPEGARRLLREAGWEDRDGDGIVEDSTGNPLRFSLLVVRSLAPLGEMLKGDLREVGADAQVEALDGDVMLPRVTSPERDYDATVVGLVSGLTRNPFNSHHCDARAQMNNFAGYCEPATDRVIDAIRAARDRQTARPLWVEFQRMTVDAEPFTPLYSQEMVPGARARLQDTNPDVRGELVNVARWWILPWERTRTAPPADAASSGV